MSYRIVTLSNPSWLRLELSRLIVEQEGEVKDAIPIEDLAMVIIDSWGVTLTHELIAQLSDANVGVVLCDPKHLPRSLVLPLYGHSNHAKILREQVECSEPKRKRLWQQIIQAKLTAQSQTLKMCGASSREVSKLTALASKVNSGDPENLEGQGAAIYFSALFGDGFTRDRDEPGANSMLNYGYAVMRAMIARSIVGAGLHPALGIHHRGPYNPFNLVDDAIEPLRPFVDEMVWNMVNERTPSPDLTPAIKRDLLKLTALDVTITGSSYTILVALERYAASLREGICGTARRLTIPKR